MIKREDDEKMGVNSVNEEGEESYSASETARLLRVTQSRVRQMLTRGELEGTRDERGHWRVSQRAVHALLEERPRRDRGRQARETSAGDELGAYGDDTPGERLRELEEKLDRAHREIVRLEGARELEETARSTLQDQLEREQAIADTERERADEERRRVDTLRAELEAARQPWWKRLFR